MGELTRHLLALHTPTLGLPGRSFILRYGPLTAGDETIDQAPEPALRSSSVRCERNGAVATPRQPAATAAAAKKSAGIGVSRRQVMAIGRSPSCETYCAVPRNR